MSSRALPICALAALLLPASAAADFTPIQLQSTNQVEQFEVATEPAISADGRYLVFTGTLGGAQGVSGIFRKDLHTGALALVVRGSDASAPSISRDGRYVSFTASAQLTPTAQPGNNVYVRDMEVPAPTGEACTSAAEQAGARCPYELASALDGSEEGLAGGAIATARVALSADGREVAFVTDNASDLESHDPAHLETPAHQVVVRYLDPKRTVLVSQTMKSLAGTPEPVPGGAVTRTLTSGSGPLLPAAALSGDGSTVAWLGGHIPAQVPTLAGERAVIEREDEFEPYDEPLWRRIADGPTAPTRRMVGGGDPLAPGCPAGGTLEEPACQGPFPTIDQSVRGGQESNYGWLGIHNYDGVPQLSFDGWTAALIGDPDSASNLFIVNMHEGLDRVQALRQLTREVPQAGQILTNPGFQSGYVPGAGNIFDLAISPDGSRVAFTTQRQQFPLAPPYYTETPTAHIGVVELYEIDLANESLVRVTHGPGDGPAFEAGGTSVPTTNGALAPTFTADGLTLAFADTASNLVGGDSNGASDVFTVTELPNTDQPGPVQIGPQPPTLEPAAGLWGLSVVPVLEPDGSVTLDVEVPGAGRLSASAMAAVPQRSRSAAAAGRASRRTRAAAAAAGRASQRPRGTVAGRASRRPHPPIRRRATARKRTGKPAVVRERTVASAETSTAIAGLVELPVHVSTGYQSLLRSPAGIYATVRVRFTGAGGPPLTHSVMIELRAQTPKTTAPKRVAAHRRAHGRGRSRPAPRRS